MHKTVSEQLFEAYCAARGLVCVRVPEGETRTPDYELLCGTQRIVVEVSLTESSQNGATATCYPTRLVAGFGRRSSTALDRSRRVRLAHTPASL